jgi:MFS family permease
MLISKSFTQLMLYRISLTLSYQILAVTVGWHIYEITKDPLSLGLIGLAEVVPYFCSALFAGHAVDVLSKRRIAIMGCAIHALIAALMVCVTLKVWSVASSRTEWFIYAGIGLAGLARAFLRPTYQVLFAQVLQRHDFARGSAVGTVIFQVSQVAGPALGGALIAWTGITFAYLASGIFALTGIIALLLLHIHEVPSQHVAVSMWTGIVQGLRFVFTKQIMLAAMALDMFAVLFGGAVSMLPAFIDEILHGSPENLGILRAAPALGSALIGVWLARAPIDQHVGKYMLAAVAGFGLTVIAFGFSTSLWFAAICLMLSGVFDGISVVVRSTIFQLITPDQMRGRISAINGIFIGSSNEIGALESGFAASLMGLSTSIVFGGIMTLVVVAACWMAAPMLRNLHLSHLQEKPHMA